MLMGRSWLSTGLLVAGLSLSVAAIGCGDDDDGDAVVAGQSGGGSGKSGAGGGGKGGAGGGGASVTECMTTTAAVVKSSFSAECVECGCTANASAFLACNNDEHCWKLLGCIEQVCGAADVTKPGYITCAQTEAPEGVCKPFVAAKSKMTAVGTVLLTKCSEQCKAAPGDKDAGAEDAGN
jgi:hypothetical protein